MASSTCPQCAPSARIHRLQNAATDSKAADMAAEGIATNKLAIAANTAAVGGLKTADTALQVSSHELAEGRSLCCKAASPLKPPAPMVDCVLLDVFITGRLNYNKYTKSKCTTNITKSTANDLNTDVILTHSAPSPHYDCRAS